jgi:hypothetical protein
MAALAVAAALALYSAGYVDASRQWETLSLATGRSMELDRASYLLRLAERIDAGDVPGARLRMVAVSSVGINSDAFGLTDHSRLSAADLLRQRFGDDALSAEIAAQESGNKKLEAKLRSTLTALCSAPAASGPDYNGACRR